MSKKLAREGWFRAWITASGVGINKENGNIQFVADLEVAEEYDFDSTTYVNITSTEERLISAYLTLYSSKYPDKTLFFGDQLKNALDWDGDIKVLNTVDYSAIPILIHVEEEEYDNKKRLKVTRICHAEDTPGSGSATKADEGELDAAIAKFAGAQRTLMGGDKPKAIPGKIVTAKSIGKPPIPKTTTTVASAPPQAPSVNKEQMAVAGEQAKVETDAASAEAEYNALSPKEKKAFNKAKKEAAIAAKATVNVPGRPKVTKPPPLAPSVEEVEETGVEVSAQQELVEALDLSASCTKDEAWASCEANAHPDRLESLAEIWTKEVNKFGNDAAVEAAKAWPEVRTAVLEQVIDDLPF